MDSELWARVELWNPHLLRPFQGSKCLVDMQKVGRKVIWGVKQQPFTETISTDMEDYQRRRLIKFKESAWKGLYYLTAELFALAVTYNEPWFTESKQFWVGPGDQRWPNQMTRYVLTLLQSLNVSAHEISYFCGWNSHFLWQFVPQFTVPREKYKLWDLLLMVYIALVSMDQAEAESALWICGWILHLQHIRPNVLGDQTKRFWCQHVTSCCCCCAYCFLLPCQVIGLWLLWCS